MEIIFAHFYTKILQGKLFRLLRNIIMDLNDEAIQNIVCTWKLTITENHNKSDEHENMNNHRRSVLRKTFK